SHGWTMLMRRTLPVRVVILDVGAILTRSILVEGLVPERFKAFRAYQDAGERVRLITAARLPARLRFQSGGNVGLLGGLEDPKLYKVRVFQQTPEDTGVP